MQLFSLSDFRLYGPEFLDGLDISNADFLKPYLISMKLQKGSEYGPQVMTAFDLLNNTSTT